MLSTLLCVYFFLSWHTDAPRMNEVQQNGLPTEEEAMGEVAAPQATSLAPPTSSGGATQDTHLQGDTDSPGTETEAFSMETQEPEATKGTCCHTSKHYASLPPSLPLTFSLFSHTFT